MKIYFYEIFLYGFLFSLIASGCKSISGLNENQSLETATVIATETMPTKVVALPISTIMPTETHVVVSPTPALDITLLSAAEVMQILNERFAENFVVPGWIHYTSHKKFDNDNGNNGVLPDGRVIPNEYIQDAWFYLDDTFQIVQMVSLMKATDGTIVQAGVLNNEVSWDPITGTRQEATLLPFSPEYFGPGKDVKLFIEFGNPSVSIVDFQGKQAVQFTIIEFYNEPITNSVDFDKPLIGTEGHIYIDLLSGQPLGKKSIVYFSDETELIFEQSIFEISLENQPPDEIMQYLETMN